MSVLTHGTITVDCIIVGKPLVDTSAVTWTHEKHSDLDLSQFVNTVKETDQYYTLTSTLNIKNPLASYSGIFKCNVQDEHQQLSESVQVSINSEFYTNFPIFSYCLFNILRKSRTNFLSTSGYVVVYMYLIKQFRPKVPINF